MCSIPSESHTIAIANVMFGGASGREGPFHVKPDGSDARAQHTTYAFIYGLIGGMESTVFSCRFVGEGGGGLAMAVSRFRGGTWSGPLPSVGLERKVDRDPTSAVEFIDLHELRSSRLVRIIREREREG